MAPEEVLAIWTAGGGGSCLPRIAPETGQGKREIDRAFLVLSLLNGQRTPEVEKLLAEHYQWEAKQDRMMESFSIGRPADRQDDVEAELQCRHCGHTAHYRLHHIMVVPVGSGEPYVAEEIECVQCQRLSEFAFTPAGLVAVNIELMRVMMTPTPEGKKQALANSPFEVLAAEQGGKLVDIHAAIQNYTEAIKKDPSDAANYVGLGNIYFNVRKPRLAKELFQHAIEKDPAYLEAYLSLAHLAQFAENSAAALALLEKGRAYLHAPKLIPGQHQEPWEFADIYCQFYNQLLETLEVNREPLHPRDFKFRQNVGRNDPCPCGSGRKYKKCCMIHGGAQERNP